LEARYHFKNGTSSKSHTGRRIFIVFISLLFLGILSFSVYAQELKPRIAVIDLQYDVINLHEASKTYFLTNELINTNKYSVVERSKVEHVINDLGLQSTPNSISDSAIEIGNLLGVQKVITGKILYNNKGRTMGRSLSINLIDIESGVIEATATVEDEIRIRRNGKFFESDASTLKLSKKSLDKLLN